VASEDSEKKVKIEQDNVQKKSSINLTLAGKVTNMLPAKLRAFSSLRSAILSGKN